MLKKLRYRLGQWLLRFDCSHHFERDATYYTGDGTTLRKDFYTCIICGEKEIEEW